MSRIAVLGTATTETILVDRDDFEALPLDGQSIFGKVVIGTDIDIDKVVSTIGGSGAAAAITFARSGHETILLSNIGQDPAGDTIIKYLDDENVDNSYLEAWPAATACTISLLDAKTAARTRLVYRGISRKTDNFSPSDLNHIAPDWLYLGSLNGDFTKLQAFCEQAKLLGVKVCFVPGPTELAERDLLLQLLASVDILILNKAEAASLVPGTALAELLSRLSNYCPTVIITDGVMGAIATDHQDAYRVGAYEQLHLRDTTGAGTAFAAGFLSAYADRADFEFALRFASANAAKVTQTYGPIAGAISTDLVLHPMPIAKLQEREL